MEEWWYRDIVDPGKLPLLAALVSFVMTFLVTRTVTRLIRAGHGPFRNVSAGGVHIHHAVPGVVLMVAGGFAGIATGQAGWPGVLAAVLFGVGAGLVLDEFALILYLADVYWTEQGRRSVEAVVLTTALLVMVLAGVVPFGVDALSEEERRQRGVLAGTVLLNFAAALVSLAKGKLWTAVAGAVVPLIAFTGAVRLARPGSFWDRRLYRNRPRTRERARRRARRHDRRWSPVTGRLQDLLGGTPDDELRPR
ncbi:hypothetical protein [Streptomyces sodiiphilus]